jgi:hypothetical protein
MLDFRRLQEARGRSPRIIEAMLATDTELAKTVADAAEHQLLAPEPEAAVEGLTAEGPIPEPQTATADPGQTASEQAFGQKEPVHIAEGMYTPAQYKAACEAAGAPDKWSENYWRGHTEAKQWVQPYDGRYANNFELKPGQSASQAVKDFLTGPTIGDFRVIDVAIEMDELRDDLGDRRFDQLFGSEIAEEDARVSSAQRLVMSSAMYTIPFYDQMMTIATNSNAVDQAPEQPEAPAVAAGVEEKPETQVAQHPAPEAIADELGMKREEEMVS